MVIKKLDSEYVLEQRNNEMIPVELTREVMRIFIIILFFQLPDQDLLLKSSD